MNKLYIKTSSLAKWVTERYFQSKDLITVEELYSAFEDLSADYDKLDEEFEDYKKYVESNYKELSVAEQVD